MCTSTRLHIVGKASFSMDAAAVRRAGIDYWDQVDIQQHQDFETFAAGLTGRSFLFFTRFATQAYSDYKFRGDEVLVFGRETSGLPPEILAFAEHSGNAQLRIPVAASTRSLNLSNSVAIVLYEGLRQTGFVGLDRSYSGTPQA